jgi:transposase
MTDATSYTPTHPHCCKVWERLDEEGRRERFAEAQWRERLLKMVGARVRRGESERSVNKDLGVDRSNYRRWKQKYELYGLDGLIDWRMPPKPKEMPVEVRTAVCTLRRADPNVSVEDIVAHVAKHHSYQTSTTTVKRVLRQERLSRRGGPVARGRIGERRLELGGMKLVEAAAMETGYLEALTQAVIGQRESVELPDPAPEVDTSDRDEFGRFLSSYNERYQADAEEEIGPGYASVEQKRGAKDPGQLHLMGAGPRIIARKLWALMVSPLLGSGRWDGIRVPRGDLLGELCGYAYMPSTLELFTRELKYLGVSNTLWEVHARKWLEQTRQWGDARRASVLYVDETNKPVWTELFSQATAVSSVGRVMPGLEVVSFHSGYGVPLWMVTYSGRAPLVKEVPHLLSELQEILEGAEVGRIVVIDAEGNSVPFLKGLEQGERKRGWVTRLKPSLVKGKRIFNRTNYRAYRDGDRVRMGECDLNDPEVKGGTFRIRVLEVERRSKGSITYLGASVLLDEKDWKPQEIADLYFERWPAQEASFRAVNRAVGLKDVHGYGKQMVDNVSVLTELDKLDARLRRLAERAEVKSGAIVELTADLMEQEKELEQQQRRHETVSRQMEKVVMGGERITPKLQALVEEQKQVREKVAAVEQGVAKVQQKVRNTAAQCNRIKADFEKCYEKRQELESRRRIFKHDVELDSLFGVLKVGLVLLVTYVLKEYLGDARMEPVTFLERLATLPARLRMTPELEIVTFDYNHRDPDVMAILAEHCEAINARQLRTRSGRLLRIQVDPPPTPRRPSPENRRVNPGDRFRRS